MWFHCKYQASIVQMSIDLGASEMNNEMKEYCNKYHTIYIGGERTNELASSPEKTIFANKLRIDSTKDRLNCTVQ